jgi:nitrite reductase/ring-hydroxylating ferredoxin subunit
VRRGAENAPAGPDRRSFLGLLLSALAALAAGLAGLGYLVITRRPVTPPPEPGPLVSLAPPPALSRGEVYDLRPHGISGYLARSEVGLIALSNRCTHQACAVPFNAVTGRFECLCHGARFALDGGVLAGPAPRPLEYFPARLEGGRLIVDATGGAVFRRDARQGVIPGS